MTLVGVIVIGVVMLAFVTIGIYLGWVLGTRNTQVEILARRLTADQRIETATRAVLADMRAALRQDLS